MPPVTPTPTPTNNDNLLNGIQSKLLEQSGVISSTASNLEERLATAVSGVQTAADKTKGAIESEYERERTYATDKANTDFIAGRSAGSGGVMNVAALRELTNTTDKNLKDLEMRKNELVLQNDAAAASKIADLQFKTLEFKLQAEQQVFGNLLGISDFGFKREAAELAKENQDFGQQATMSEIALQYGLNVQPGETLQSLTKRAMVFAAPEQRARLAKMQSETALNYAQAAKYKQDGITNSNFSDNGNIDAMAIAYNSNPAILAGDAISVANKTKVINRAAEMKNEGILSSGVYGGKSADKIKDEILSDPNLVPAQKESALRYVDTNYGTLAKKVEDQKKSTKSGDPFLKRASADILGTAYNFAGGIGDFIGSPTPTYDYKTKSLK